MPPKSNKRAKLLKAARKLIHRQGFQSTTLADIATAADVPLGNVYYYFKTKDDIVRAVVEERTQRFVDLSGQWEQHHDPVERLKCFIQMPITISRSIADHGCPVGSLLQELSKKPDSSDLATQTLQAQLNWVIEQFHQLGCDDPEPLGRHFVASLQGASLLANTLNQPSVIIEQSEQLIQWLHTVVDNRLSIKVGDATGPE